MDKIAFSSEKDFSSESGEKYAQIKHRFFFTGGSVVIDYGLVFFPEATV